MAAAGRCESVNHFDTRDAAADARYFSGRKSGTER